MTRNEAREIMMQILFELDASKTIKGDSSEGMAETKAKALKLTEEKLAGAHVMRGYNLLKKIIDSLDEIDEVLNQNSTKWKVSRMPKVDLAIMRLAIGEMRFADDIPEAVSVNEAINLAKAYGTENSARFIHGVLGAITK